MYSTAKHALGVRGDGSQDREKRAEIPLYVLLETIGRGEYVLFLSEANSEPKILTDECCPIFRAPFSSRITRPTLQQMSQSGLQRSTRASGFTVHLQGTTRPSLFKRSRCRSDPWRILARSNVLTDNDVDDDDGEEEKISQHPCHACTNQFSAWLVRRPSPVWAVSKLVCTPSTCFDQLYGLL